tara:strand:- start:3867 stop:5240 length:1374 start_codon:yes stop_codon:yes gene_type:complete
MIIALTIVVIVFYLTLTRPILGLIAFLVLSFSIPLDIINAGNLGTATKIAGLGLAGGYFLRALLLDLKLDFTPIFMSSFFFLMVWRIFESSRSQGLQAEMWIKSVSSLPEMVFTVVLFFILVLIVCNVLKTKDDFFYISRWMVYGISISAFYSIFISLGIVDPMPEAASNWEMWGRASGLRDNPNDFIAYNGLAIGLQLPFIMTILNSKSKLFTKDFITYSVLLVVMLYGQILSGSRTGLLMIGVMGFASLILYRKELNYKRISIAFMAFIIFILAIIFLGLINPLNLVHLFDLPIISDLFSGNSYVFDASTLHRLERQMIVLEMISKNPFFGIGLGNYELFMGDILGYGSSSHNFYVETLGEQGLIGLSLLFALLFEMFRNFIKARKLFMLMKSHTFILLTNGFLIASSGLCFERLFSSAEVTTKIIYILFGISYAVLKIAEIQKSETQRTLADVK